MRRLAVAVLVLAVLAGAALVADLLVTAAAEERLADRVRQELDAPAQVKLGEWPVTLRLLAGRGVERVDVRMTDVPADGTTIDRIDVTMRGVPLGVGDLLDGVDGVPEAETARFEAVVGEESLRQLLGVPDAVAAVVLTGGQARLEVAGLAIVEARVRARDGSVVVEPDNPAAALVGLGQIPIDLSDRPGAPYVEHVEVREGALVLKGRLVAVEADPARGT